MADILQSSVIWRGLRAIGLFLQRAVEGSAVLGAFRHSWAASATRKGLVAFGESDDAAARSSFPEKLLRWLDRLLAGWHSLGVCIRSSLTGRLCAGLLRWLQDSKLLGWVFRDGVTGAILTVLGLYAGVDWLLRDALAIAVLSSGWDELLLIFSIAWIFWKRTDRTERSCSRTTNLDVFVLLFLAIGFCLLFVVSPFFSIAVSGYRAACQYILWFFVVTRLIRDDRDRSRLYCVMVVLATVIALHGVYRYIVGVPIPEHWTDQAEADVRTRVFSIFGSPNIMADYMVMFAPMAAGLAYSVKNKKGKLLAWFAVFCMCFACLFTMSRGGWVAMAVAIVVFALLVDRKLFLLILAAGVAAMFLPFVASRLGYLFTDEFAHSTAHGGRASRWAIGLNLLHASSPVFGFGQGMFGGAVAMQNQVYRNIQYFYLDNYYIKTLVEMGYVGLGGFILMQLSMLLTGCRSLYKAKKAEDGTYPLTAGIFSGLCGVLVHCYFENIFEEPYMMATFWILAAMMVYLGIYRNRKA